MSDQDSITKSASSKALAEKEITVPIDPMVQEMMEVGLFYGRQKTHTNPQMKNYVVHNRNGVEIINLYKTAEALQTAVAMIKQKAEDGGLFLFVGTQEAFVDQVFQSAGEVGAAYVTRRWLGGTLTNFGILSKRIEHFKKLKAGMAAGEYDKYTKKERVVMDKEIEKLDIFFGGLATLTRLPDALILIDPKLHNTAVREARQMNIPVVALTNVDADPRQVDYAIVGNNKSRPSVMWFLQKVVAAVKDGRNNAPKVEVSQ